MKLSRSIPVRPSPLPSLICPASSFSRSSTWFDPSFVLALKTPLCLISFHFSSLGVLTACPLFSPYATVRLPDCLQTNLLFPFSTIRVPFLLPLVYLSPGPSFLLSPEYCPLQDTWKEPGLLRDQTRRGRSHCFSRNVSAGIPATVAEEV